MNRIAAIRIPRWVDGLWLLMLTLYIIAGVPLVPLHGDEATQTFMSRDFYYLFVEHDPSRLMYRDWNSIDGQAATEQDLRLKDGVVHRYLFGASAYFAGYRVEDLNNQWDWGAGWDWNHANGHVPARDLLLRARTVSALVLAVGMVALFGIAHAVGGRGAAYFATLLYATNPALLLNARRAMMEGTMTCFSLLVVLAGIWVLQSRHWWAYVLLGIFSGLAVASKHTAAVTVAAVFVACTLIYVHRAIKDKSHIPALRHIAALFATGILALVVFYALNPAWWSNPVARAVEVARIRAEFITAQQSTFGGYENIAARVSGFFWQTFGLQNMYAETTIDNFREHLADAIVAYEASPTSGFISGSPVVSFGYALITGIGFVALWRDKAVATEMRWLVGVWSVAMVLVTLLLTPLEWQRYYLPAYPPVMLMAALGLRRVIVAIGNRLT